MYGYPVQRLSPLPPPSVRKRAEKLKITELHMGIKDKLAVLQQILVNRNILPEQIAYIGDDVNDLEIMKHVGFTACPADALKQVRSQVDYICEAKGGEGCFRELAELILEAQTQEVITEILLEA